MGIAPVPCLHSPLENTGDGGVRLWGDAASQRDMGLLEMSRTQCRGDKPGWYLPGSGWVPSTQTCHGSTGSMWVAEGQLSEEPSWHLRSGRRKQQEHGVGEEGEEEDGAAAAKGNLRADGIPGLGEGGSWGDWAGTAAGLSGGCSPLGSRCPPPCLVPPPQPCTPVALVVLPQPPQGKRN